MCIVGYAGFFHYDELSKLKELDINFFEEHMEIFVESSKTNQLREGAWVVIACTQNKLCPVAMLERYFKLASITGEQDKFLLLSIAANTQ